MVPITRPVIRYYGGKWRIAPWTISHFPVHRVYVEPYGGAASVLLRKPRVYAEIYNDLDSEVVNVFRVLRDPGSANELERLLRLTPYAREEFLQAYTPAEGPVEQARRTIVKAFMGHSSDAIYRVSVKDAGLSGRIMTRSNGTGYRGDSNRGGSTPAHDWMTFPHHIMRFQMRLQGVVIENKPATDLIRQYDRDDTLFYIDPPYPRESRSDERHGYRHDMSDDDHHQLAAVVRSIRGMAIVSGYPCELYDRVLFPDWRCVTTKARTRANNESTEVLWLSPNVPAIQPELFEVTGQG